MMVLDVNVLIYAFWAKFELHQQFRAWLLTAINGSDLVLVPDVVLSGFIRIVTGGKAVQVPEPLENAIRFCDEVLSGPAARLAHPGDKHWRIFIDLCRTANATGALTSDAFLAASALENDAEMISCDRNFQHFPGPAVPKPSRIATLERPDSRRRPQR